MFHFTRINITQHENREYRIRPYFVNFPYLIRHPVFGLRCCGVAFNYNINKVCPILFIPLKQLTPLIHLVKSF